MKRFANWVMERRARGLLRRLAPFLPSNGSIADVGSGTGHNAAEIRGRTGLEVTEYDVDDMHWVGPGPVLMADGRIPADDRSFDALLLLFVLQYPESAEPLLKEASRVTRGPLIVVQSTYQGRLGLAVLRIRSFAWGRGAHRAAALAGLVSGGGGSLRARTYFTRDALADLFRRADLVVREFRPAPWPGLGVSRDLYVLESIRP